MSETGTSKGRPPAWLAIRPRSDLAEAIGASSRLPFWAQRFLVRHGGNDLIVAVEDLVDHVLGESGALAGGATTDLACISKHLRARVDTVRSPKGPRGRGAGHREKWVRGSLRPRSDTSWRIVVGDTDELFRRESIAHELAHILLYWDGASIDLEAWRKTRWTLSEEAVCNYMCRLLLVPRSRLSEHGTRLVSSARDLIAAVVSSFQVPHRLAALRWLDLSESQEGGAVAVLEWRQYHPFADQLVKYAASGLGDRAQGLVRVGRGLASRFPEAEHADAFRLWIAALAGEKAVFGAKPPPTLPLSSQEQRAVLNVLNPTRVSSCRPEWIAWRGRPRKAFVPLRRGGVRAGSLAARLFMGEEQDGFYTEEVSIGDFAGRFLVDGFAHGRREEGKRFVLQTFSHPRARVDG